MDLHYREKDGKNFCFVSKLISRGNAPVKEIDIYVIDDTSQRDFLDSVKYNFIEAAGKAQIIKRIDRFMSKVGTNDDNKLTTARAETAEVAA